MTRFTPKRLYVSLASLLLLSSGIVVSSTFRQGTKTRNSGKGDGDRIKAFYVRINDDESLEYEWRMNVEKQFYRDQVSYSGYLIRTVDGIPRRYFVSEDSFIPGNLELHDSKEGHVWLVQSGMNESGDDVMGVIASLDRRSGKFINRYRMVVNWRLSEAQQEKIERPREQAGDLSHEQPYPNWAKSAGGTTLCKTGKVVLYNFLTG
jgi:hypothetical protein